MERNCLTRFLCLLLAFITALSALAACAESRDEPDAVTENNSIAEETTAETELTRENTPDDLPAELDFEGATATFLDRTKSWFVGEMHVDDFNGEVVNDAVYQRMVNVSERLNVKLEFVDKDDVTSTANLSISSAADDYSIVVDSAVSVVQYGAKGHYCNMMGDNVPYINLEQPWWAKYYTEQANIGGKIFFITGDAGWSLIKLAFVTYFNKKMVENYNIDNPYDLVANGEWTRDVFAQLCSQVYSDINGNGKHDKNDIFGFGAGDMINYDVYWSAYDLSIVERDEDDMPYISVNTDKFQTAIEDVYDLFFNNEGTLKLAQYGADEEQDELARKFGEDELLFTTLRIIATDLMRDMESDYGIIPCPKFDEVQDNYYTFVHDQYSVFGIPVTVVDTELASAVLEAFAADSYRHVTPAYYDIVLNGKYVRDEESTQMLEIALKNVKIDFSWIYTYNLNSVSQNFFRNLLRDKKTTFSSYYAKSEKSLNRYMDKLLAAYEKIEN